MAGPPRPALNQLATAAGTVGALGSVALTMRAGSGAPALLLLIMSVWVLMPFGVLFFAEKRIRGQTNGRAGVLDLLWIFVAMTSLTSYGFRTVLAATKPNAFVFVVIPPVLCALCLASIWLSGRKQDGRRR